MCPKDYHAANLRQKRTLEQLMPCGTRETELVRDAYAALNRGDIPGFTSMFDEAIEWIEPSEFPLAGTYRGLEAVTEHAAKARGSWAEGSCEPQRFIVAGERVIVIVHVHVRLKHETDWREGRLADVYTFRDGKAVQFRTFMDETQAIEWAAASGHEAT